MALLLFSYMYYMSEHTCVLPRSSAAEGTDGCDPLIYDICVLGPSSSEPQKCTSLF